MSLQTFYAFHFHPDDGAPACLILRNVKDGSLSWTGKIGSDDVIESLRWATLAMINDDKDETSTAYGRLEALA